MTALTIEPNLADFDGIYERLIALHEGLADAASQRLNARLILILLNHIGDAEVIEAAFAAARAAEPEPADAA